MNKGVAVLLFTFAFFKLSGQNQKMNWYFGYGAAITFSSGSPEVLTDNPLTHESGTSASISDKNTGELLFYTNGIKLMDGDHQLVKDNLLPFNPLIRDVLIIENELKVNSYFLVILAHGVNFPGRPSLSYYVIDMVNGKPIMNEAVSFASGQFQKITAVKNCRTGGSWLLTYEAIGDEMLAFNVGVTSISPFPVRSPVGVELSYIGDIVSNSTGELVAISEYSSGTDTPHVVVMKMDKQCGTLSDAKVYYYPLGDYAFGLAFSPSDRYLYVTYSVWGSDLVQFEISNGDHITISHSTNNYNELQTAPDGKIYMATGQDAISGQRLAVIHEPDKRDIDCNFETDAIDLGNGRAANFHLPNFVQDYSENSCEYKNPEFEIENLCLGKALEIRKKSDFEEPDSFFWLIEGQQYADLLPKYIPGRTGRHQLQFINLLCDAADTHYYEITITELKRVVLGNDTTICKGSELTLNAGAGIDVVYYWKHNGSTDSMVTIDAPGWYWVELNPDGCKSTDSIRIDFKDEVWLDLGAEYFLCEDDNELVKLKVGKDFENYLWAPTGDTTQWIHVNKLDSYFVIVKDYRGCEGEDGTVVRRRCKPLLYFPTAFSPNNDQLNDLYLPIGQDVVDYKLEVYNVWGQLVFSTTNIHEGWNGTFRGESSPIGQYLWTCSYTGYVTKNTQKLKFESGYLFLMR